MDYLRIRDIDDISELESLVDQLEHMPSLTAEDVGPLLVPLTRRTCELGFGMRGAEITERVLFICLSRLPPDYESRTAVAANHPYPNTTMYNRAIIAWGNLRTPESAQRAEKIFQLMMSEYLQEAEWVRKEQKQNLLENHDTSSEKESSMVVRAPQPCRRCYKSLLRAHAVSGAPNGPARAYDILSEMERLSDISRILDSHNARQAQVQQQNQQQSQPDTALLVDKIREETGPNNGSNSNMNNIPFGVPKDRDLALGGGSFTHLSIERPDQATYNSVLSAYAKAFVLKHPHALNRIKLLVNRMHALYEITGDEEFTLDWISYHAVLRAYSKFTAYSTDPLDPSFVEEVQGILRQIHRDEQRLKLQGKSPISDNLSMPWAYGVAIEAWTKTLPVADGVQRADDIVMALLGKKKLEHIPNPSMGKWPRQDSIMQVVRAWQRSGLPEAEQRIERLLRVVVETPYKRIYLLNESMESWTRSDWEHAPEVVEKMLEWSFSRMTPECKPTGQTFMIAIKAWLTSKSDGAPYRAELIMQKMVQIYDQSGDRYYRPGEVHLRYVFTAWMNRSGDGRRYYGTAGNKYPAEHVDSLLAQYRGADWNDNVYGLYAMAIRTWARQSLPPGETEPNPLHRAVALLNELGELTGSLDAYPCNWVIQACCRKQQTMEGRREAYGIAMDTFRRGQRNPRTFVLLMKALRAQIPVFDAKHHQLVEELFHECCSSGLLSQDMVWEIASIAPAKVLHKLFRIHFNSASFVVQVRDQQSGGHDSALWNENPPTSLLVQNLPREWSARVKVNNARPQANHKK